MTGRRDTSGMDMTWALRLANREYDAIMIFRALATKPSGRREVNVPRSGGNLGWSSGVEIPVT